LLAAPPVDVRSDGWGSTVRMVYAAGRDVHARATLRERRCASIAVAPRRAEAHLISTRCGPGAKRQRRPTTSCPCEQHVLGRSLQATVDVAVTTRQGTHVTMAPAGEERTSLTRVAKRPATTGEPPSLPRAAWTAGSVGVASVNTVALSSGILSLRPRSRSREAASAQRDNHARQPPSGRRAPSGRSRGTRHPTVRRGSPPGPERPPDPRPSGPSHRRRDGR
jgi:hypothetical protein